MELTKLMGWLSGFPLFRKVRWEVDCLPQQPGMATLTSQGVKVLDTIEDVMGNWKKTMQYTCALAFSGNGKAQDLLDLQHWVEMENGAGACPQFGQGRKSVSLTEGRRLSENKLGLCLYTAQLKVTYEIYYEVNENG